jgi:hypothetical protein
MTIHALQANVTETPFVCFLMTGETGCGKVGAFQREFSGIMLIDGVGELLKSKCVMANGAIGHQAVLHELPFVVIGMAISALCIL